MNLPVAIISRIFTYGDEDEELSEYEKERMIYLLYEEDVTNYLYKNIQIVEDNAN